MQAARAGFSTETSGETVAERQKRGRGRRETVGAALKLIIMLSGGVTKSFLIPI